MHSSAIIQAVIQRRTTIEISINGYKREKTISKRQEGNNFKLRRLSDNQRNRSLFFGSSTHCKIW